MRHLKKEFLFIVACSLLLLEFFAFGYGVTLFMSGFHTIDLLSDVRLVINHYGGSEEGVQECNLGGECFYLNETYRLGWLTAFNGYIVTLFSAVIFTATLCLVINLGLEGTK